MGGGLMQLVAYGAQDVFLTGNPQISFFKVVYRRHTNFAMESIEQTFNGNPQLGNKVTCTISRNGDLITNLWLECTIKQNDDGTTGLCNSLGHALIEYVELEIGGQRIDKHYGEWLEILSELTLPEEKRQGFKEMIGRRDAYLPTSATGVENMGAYEANEVSLYVPLQFFFCRNPGLALPLIALQYHEVKINVKLREAKELVSQQGLAAGVSPTTGVPTLSSLRMYADYIYLDTDERRRFAQVSHEYLIEQLQHTGPDVAKTTNHRLNFNHPVKELVWVYRKNGAEPMNFNCGVGSGGLGANADYVDYYLNPNDSTIPATGEMSLGDVVDPTLSTNAKDWFTTCKLQLNGHDRFSERKAAYFRLVQPYQHHTRVPAKHVYAYCFALNPESHQPSGSCNFSRLDNVTLILEPNSSSGVTVGESDELLVFATNYNVLRIMSGMGGLAYSN